MESCLLFISDREFIAKETLMKNEPVVEKKEHHPIEGSLVAIVVSEISILHSGRALIFFNYKYFRLNVC